MERTGQYFQRLLTGSVVALDDLGGREAHAEQLLCVLQQRPSEHQDKVGTVSDLSGRKTKANAIQYNIFHYDVMGKK